MESIINAALDCLDVPWKHQGRSLHDGLDCAGVVVHCARAAGADYQDTRGYPRLPFDGLLKKQLDAQPCLFRRESGEPQPGDVLLLRIVDAPQHLAICVGDGVMLHSYQNIGRVVCQRIDSNWRHRLVAVYGWKL